MNLNFLKIMSFFIFIINFHVFALEIGIQKNFSPDALKLANAAEQLKQAILNKNDKEAAKLLEKYGDDIINKSGKFLSELPSLQDAYNSGDIDLVELFKEYGAKIVQSYNGKPYQSDHLMSLKELKDAYIKRYYPGQVKTLLEISADKSAKNFIGKFKIYSDLLFTVNPKTKSETILEMADDILKTLPEELITKVIISIFDMLTFVNLPFFIYDIKNFKDHILKANSIYLNLKNPDLNILYKWLLNRPEIEKYIIERKYII